MKQSVMKSHSAPPFFQGEKWLVYTGLLGFLLAAICAIWVMLHGGPVAPNGDVSKVFSFNAALGIFLLTTAAIIPLSALGTRSRAIFRWSYIPLALYSYGAETVQNFRGVDPRFVKNGTPFDVAVGSIFTFVALLLVLFYVFIAIQFFRRKAYSLHPELAISIRYAMIAIMLSFAAGLWISFNYGRVVGEEGNIIWLHGIGFHALQAVPFVAWLAERKKHVSTARTGFIHLTGIAYLLGLAAIGWQTYLGRAVLEMSVFPIIAACCFLVSFIPIVFFLLQKNDAKKLHYTSDIQN
ncbi:hypothetical membrane protein [Brevibacillus brevis NBRC 100599]|uniref:Hypothetical membrane protein n=1 Tax=Brevibacillus brevis (strain 47 / JCM 6285 / NBRC 100599) TaxID=358681 RepID=C0Z7G4_BREBN|nr:hypothetical protein [Brevibacillus brevis]BAH42207.1 hypothetical membrane protein [Brevibacillus brevis NBRC 100599]